MTESTQDPNKGTAESGASNQEGQPGQQKPVDEKALEKRIEGSLYSKFQSNLSEKEKEIKKLQSKLERREAELEEIEGIDKLREEAEELKRLKFETEASQARANLITKEFPQLKGKEQFIPLGTEEEMRNKASEMVKEFGLSGKGEEESLKSEASPTFASTMSRLSSLSPQERKEALKKLPDEVIKKMMNETRERGY